MSSEPLPPVANGTVTAPATAVSPNTSIEHRFSKGPPEQYGLALSGGGIRALFHYGAIRRINDLGYLRRIDRVGGRVRRCDRSGLPRPLVGQAPVGRPGARYEPSNGARAAGHAAGRDADRHPADRVRGPAVRVAIEVACPNSRCLFLPRAQAGGHPPSPRRAAAAQVRVQRLRPRDRQPVPILRAIHGHLQGGPRGPPKGIRIATAVAASASFPPFVSPMNIDMDPAAVEDPGGADLHDDKRLRSRAALVDGGAYDNLALEPITVRCHQYLVSDAGWHTSPSSRPPGSGGSGPGGAPDARHRRRPGSGTASERALPRQGGASVRARRTLSTPRTKTSPTPFAVHDDWPVYLDTIDEALAVPATGSRMARQLGLCHVGRDASLLAVGRRAVRRAAPIPEGHVRRATAGGPSGHRG